MSKLVEIAKKVGENETAPGTSEREREGRVWGRKASKQRILREDRMRVTLCARELKLPSSTLMERDVTPIPQSHRSVWWVAISQNHVGWADSAGRTNSEMNSEVFAEVGRPNKLCMQSTSSKCTGGSIIMMKQGMLCDALGKFWLWAEHRTDEDGTRTLRVRRAKPFAPTPGINTNSRRK